MAWIDQEDAWLTATIRRHGWAIQYVGGEECSRPGCECPPDDEPPFAYTIGLFGLGRPELLVFGLPPPETAELLRTVAGRVASGDNLMPGLPVDVPALRHPVIPEEIPDPGRIVLTANDFYRRPSQHSVPVLQLGWADGESDVSAQIVAICCAEWRRPHSTAEGRRQERLDRPGHPHVGGSPVGSDRRAPRLRLGGGFLGGPDRGRTRWR